MPLNRTLKMIDMANVVMSMLKAIVITHMNTDRPVRTWAGREQGPLTAPQGQGSCVAHLCNSSTLVFPGALQALERHFLRK